MFETQIIDSWIFCYDPRLTKVKNFVDVHFADPVSLDTIAGVAGLEKTYFSKYFRKKTGVCFRDWLSAVRVNRALDIMMVRDLSITKMAFAVGFQDLRTFERAVEKCTGLTPNAVKKQLRLRVDAKLDKPIRDFPII